MPIYRQGLVTTISALPAAPAGTSTVNSVGETKITFDAAFTANCDGCPVFKIFSDYLNGCPACDHIVVWFNAGEGWLQPIVLGLM